MILGLSFSHNCSVVVLDESGRIKFACSEERLSRRKNEWGIPEKTLSLVFSDVVHPSRITRVAVGERCESRSATDAFAQCMYLANYQAKDALIRNKKKMAWTVTWELFCRLFRKKNDFRHLVTDHLKSLGVHAPIDFIEHHEAHAASAYYCSPFSEGLAVTLDGEGDRTSCSVWRCRDGIMEKMASLPEACSVGKFYRCITSLLGFTINRHEGKVTGLAAHGNPDRFRDAMQQLLFTRFDGTRPTIHSVVAESMLQRFRFRSVDPLRLLAFTDLAIRASTWDGLLGSILRRHFIREIGSAFDLDWELLTMKDKADIAAAAQEVLEATVLSWITHQLAAADTRTLLLAGGVFANVKLNQSVLDGLPVDNIFIQPAMGDEGLALGGGLRVAHRVEAPRISVSAMHSTYFGPSIQRDEIETALERAELTAREFEEDEIAETVASALAEYKVVGIARGAMEFGPRALGHRSILAHPGRKDFNDKINRRLNRSDFMPFAPVVLEDMVNEVFEGSKLTAASVPGRFMTIAIDVKREWHERLAGVVHSDGTARPQIVGADDDSLYYEILRRFHELTGLGCLVNTSFNLHEEPIVASAADAIKALELGAIDLLIVGNHVVYGADHGRTTA